MQNTKHNSSYYQNGFSNAMDALNRTAYPLVKGGAYKWARVAERKSIIGVQDITTIGNLTNLRNMISHGGAGRVKVTQSDIDKANHYLRIMISTASMMKRKEPIHMPAGTYRSFVKHIVLTGADGEEFHFTFDIVSEYQSRSFDDGTSFSGKGYTIYVRNASYKAWALANNRQREFHFYASPVGNESICWNRLITSFQDANKIMFVWAKRYVKIFDSLKRDSSLNLHFYDARQQQRYSVPAGTFRSQSIRFSKSAYAKIQETLGTLKPEQGGILGISNEEDIVDFFVHDKKADVGTYEYSPNVSYIDEVINNEWAPNGIEFVGFIHSHPYGSSRLSSADIQYAKRIMKAFGLSYLFMPLANSNQDASFQIHGYYVQKKGTVIPCEIEVVDEEEGVDLLEDEEQEILDCFEKQQPAPQESKEEHAFSRMESFLPLNYLKDCCIIGVGCGGSREFYIDMARMGIKNFVLMDGDAVSLTNVATQNIYKDELGQKKVDVIRNRIQLIDESCVVDVIPEMLDDTLNDDWIWENLIEPRSEKHILLCAFTDNFYAQARLANIALKYELPFLSAQHHRYGLTSEIVYWYPSISRATPQDVLSDRYQAYHDGYKNSVTSAGSPIFNTVRLNALCEKIALGMLLYEDNPYNVYSSFLVYRPDSNLILLRQSSLFGTDSELQGLFLEDKDHLFDDPVFVRTGGSQAKAIEDTRTIWA